MALTQREIEALAEQVLASKALTTSDLTGGTRGGLLNEAQADRFITYMFDLTQLTRLRLVRMDRPKMELDRLTIGTRLLRKATEMATITDTSSFTTKKITLTTTKLYLPWDISRDTYKANIERSGVEDTVQRLMAIQAGNDFEDIAINGDTDGPATINAFNGWRKLAYSSSDTHQVMFSGSGLSKSVFSKMIKSMPVKYRTRRTDLRFYVPSNLVQDYIDTLTDRETQLGDALIAEGARAIAYGIPIVEVALLPSDLSGTYPGATGNHGDVYLTFPENFITGILEDIVIFHWFNARKDAHEFTMFIEGTVALENEDALVCARDIKERS